MSSWVAVSYGALDVRAHEFADGKYDYIATPIRPGAPIFLYGAGAALWNRMVHESVSESDLTPTELQIVHDMESMNIASRDKRHAARIRSIDEPWLVSPLHEVVYGVLARVAAQENIRVVFIKGPTLHAQGLRERAHSGDVDCWVEPGKEMKLARAIESWGWKPAVSAFTGTRVLHSLTMRANDWGCAIDVHSWFPGMSAPPPVAFDVVFEASEPRDFANVTVRTPPKELHAVISGLNEVRPLRGRLPDDRQVQTATNALLKAGDAAIGAASSVGAEFALAEALSSAFPEHRLDLSSATVPPDWAWRQEGSMLRAYLKALKIIPPADRARVIYRVLWPTAESLRFGPFSRDKAVLNLGTLRFRRLVEGLRRIGALRR